MSMKDMQSTKQCEEEAKEKKRIITANFRDHVITFSTIITIIFEAEKQKGTWTVSSDVLNTKLIMK